MNKRRFFFFFTEMLSVFSPVYQKKKNTKIIIMFAFLNNYPTESKKNHSVYFSVTWTTQAAHILYYSFRQVYLYVSRTRIAIQFIWHIKTVNKHLSASSVCLFVVYIWDYWINEKNKTNEYFCTAWLYNLWWTMSFPFIFFYLVYSTFSVFPVKAW